MIPCKKTAEAVATAAAAGVATPASTTSEVAAFNRENLTKQSDKVLFISLLVLTLSIPVTGVNLALENPPAGSGMASWITTILWLKEKVTSCVLHRWQE